MEDHTLRQRAKHFDRLWEEAFEAPPHDTTAVFEQAEAEGFHPVKVAPPDMFAHEDELNRLASVQAQAIVRELEANSLGDMKLDIAALKEDVGGLKEDVASMAEDVAKVPQIEAEIRYINQRLEAIEDRI